MMKQLQIKTTVLMAVLAMVLPCWAQVAVPSLRIESIEPESIVFRAEEGTYHYQLSRLTAGFADRQGSLQTGRQGGFSLTGLEPATFYRIQLYRVSGQGDTLDSYRETFATVSGSSGEIQVYFNNNVFNGVSDGSHPISTNIQVLEAAIVARLDAATETIDAALYNISRANIIRALARAYNRGVRVRYIKDSQTSNTALDPAPPFPILSGSPGPGIMHNKFFIIDAEKPDSCWVLMGSMNMTDSNMEVDPNNMVFLQDQSLAKAYELEFEEMWGSNDQWPNGSLARFGEEKTDNTPHHFSIGGVPIESYFSPSDGTTQQIVDALQTADKSISFALLTTTKDELRDALLDAHESGISVRGLVENTGDSGSDFTFLQVRGLPILQHSPSGSLHHKYAIIDGLAPEDDPIVVTGSHNWSNSAEFRNDENTLIIHDRAIGNIFSQEFEQRWCDVTDPGGDCVVSAGFPGNLPEELTVFPNPSSGFFRIELPESGSDRAILLSVHNAGGTLLFASRLNTKEQPKETVVLDLSPFPAGHYLIRMVRGGQTFVRLVQKSN